MGGLLPDTVGRTDGTELRQNGPIRLKVGTICVTTSIFIDTLEAQVPGAGVKTYVVVPVLVVFMTAGFQVPLIVGVLVDEVGSAGGSEFKQSGPI